ncbi:hypothetical protein D9613_011888 [Agrocybe pediades]|uniref:Uncharacterized protein n=1 Tax=Agrocybe pediades TaxID=84607 RepID=A0A8H4VLW7_9AGAR|nr:hypothetical protein D9613_011888 [Agrocybe pediades]
MSATEQVAFPQAQGSSNREPLSANQQPVSEPLLTTTPAARLITRDTDRFPYPAIWGFPIDPVKVGRQYDAGNPEHGPDAVTYINNAMLEMDEICGEIIGEPYNKSRRRWDLGYRIHPNSSGNEVYVFAVVTSTLPDPRLVPDEKKIAELKTYFRTTVLQESRAGIGLLCRCK